MSWTDDITGADELLPMFGMVGVLLFLLVCGFAYISYNSAVNHGIEAKVVSIGTCNDDGCAVKVSVDDGKTIDRATSSLVFIGDTVYCNSNRCYRK